MNICITSHRYFNRLNPHKMIDNEVHIWSPQTKGMTPIDVSNIKLKTDNENHYFYYDINKILNKELKELHGFSGSVIQNQIQHILNQNRSCDYLFVRPWMNISFFKKRSNPLGTHIENTDLYIQHLQNAIQELSSKHIYVCPCIENPTVDLDLLCDEKLLEAFGDQYIKTLPDKHFGLPHSITHINDLFNYIYDIVQENIL